MDVLLDGDLMVSREALHDLLAEKLEFPSYYGRNLDALYDLLGENSRLLKITLIHADLMIGHLGNYGYALLKTFTDAANAYPNVIFFTNPEIN